MGYPFTYAPPGPKVSGFAGFLLKAADALSCAVTLLSKYILVPALRLAGETRLKGYETNASAKRKARGAALHTKYAADFAALVAANQVKRTDEEAAQAEAQLEHYKLNRVI